MNKLSILFITGLFFLSCEEPGIRYICNTYNCTESDTGTYSCLDDCLENCLQLNESNTRVTVFIYENCPIAQYMCGPLRDAYRYFCDTLNQNIVFRGFSPNAFSTDKTLTDFTINYDIPFDLTLDYSQIDNAPGPYTQQYLPMVTPEIFIEFKGDLIYRGMIDNSYQSLGQWSPPTEHYMFDVLTNIVNGIDVEYYDTEAIGCLINY